MYFRIIHFFPKMSFAEFLKRMRENINKTNEELIRRSRDVRLNVDVNGNGCPNISFSGNESFLIELERERQMNIEKSKIVDLSDNALILNDTILELSDINELEEKLKLLTGDEVRHICDIECYVELQLLDMVLFELNKISSFIGEVRALSCKLF